MLVYILESPILIVIMKRQSLKSSFFYSLFYQVLNLFIPIVTMPYLARVLGADGLGIQSYTMSIQQFFLLFSSLGAFIYGSRIISMNRNDTYLRSKNFFEIEIIVTSCTLLVSLVWLLLCYVSNNYTQYYLILLIGLIANLFDISWFFNGLELFKLTVIRSLVFKVLGAISIFVFVQKHQDLWIYILILSLSTLFSNLTLWPYLRKYVVKVNIHELCFKSHLKETLIYFIPTISTSIYTVLDRTLIGVITKDPAQNGYYQQAEKISVLVQALVFYAINSVLGVRNAYLYAEKRYEEIKQKIDFSLNFILFLGFACCFGIIGIAKTIIPIYLGSNFNETIYILYIFAPIIVIIGFSNCLGTQYYTPCGLRKQSSIYLIIGALFNLIFNLILIPFLAARGAAISSVIAELLISILYVKNCNGFCKLGRIIQIAYKKLFAAILMLIAIKLIEYLPFVGIKLVLVQIIAGIIMYVVSMILLKDTWCLLMLNRFVKSRNG